MSENVNTGAAPDDPDPAKDVTPPAEEGQQTPNEADAGNTEASLADNAPRQDGGVASGFLRSTNSPVPDATAPTKVPKKRKSEAHDQTEVPRSPRRFRTSVNAMPIRPGRDAFDAHLTLGGEPDALQDHARGRCHVPSRQGRQAER
jgi:hypothetical protein